MVVDVVLCDLKNLQLRSPVASFLIAERGVNEEFGNSYGCLGPK